MSSQTELLEFLGTHDFSNTDLLIDFLYYKFILKIMDKSLYKIIWSLSSFNDEDSIKNNNFNNRYQELKNIVQYCSDTWNNIVYAWNKTVNQKDEEYDVRFYYQSIVFNLYILGAITKIIGNNIIEKDIHLKDLRDNIAHIDEKLKKPLNFVKINDIFEDAVIRKDGITNYNVSLVGLQINDQLNTASPLGVVEDVVFSSLQASKKSSYDKFVSFKITKDGLITIQVKLLKLLKNYFNKIKLIDINKRDFPF